MKRLSKKEKLWFDSLRTEKRTFHRELRPDPFEHLFEGPLINRRYQWIKGLVSIASAVILICFSFSSVWANPEDLPPPNDVLIPMDEVMKGQITIKENEGPSNGESKNEESDTTKKQEQEHTSNEQVPTEDNTVKEPSTNEQQKVESGLEKKSTDPLPSSNESVNASTKQELSKEHSQSSTIDVNPSKSQQEADITSYPQTENGGKMPDTATPWSAFLLRGFGLLLFGIGLRAIHRARMA